MVITQIPFVAGALLAWSLAAPPGPINALMAHAAARRGFWAGWVYGLGAVAGDATMLLLTLLGVGAVMARLPLLAILLSFAGAILMLWFAWGAWKTARQQAAAKLGVDSDDRPEAWWRAFGKAFLIVTTSPFNWGFWLTAGSGALAIFGTALMLGFFVGILLWTIAWASLAHVGAARIKRFAEFVSYAAAISLVVFAVGIFVFAAERLRTFAAAA